MKMNGEPIIIFLQRNEHMSGSWDPYLYRGELESMLSKYIDVEEIKRYNKKYISSNFKPIEYKDIAKGNYLTFNLVYTKEKVVNKNFIPEATLLFGTMRAYLGNVLVTPQATWLNLENHIFFPVKSEFVVIKPKDNLIYFWWAYLKSPEFLKKLPIGGGKTRPRLHIETLIQTPADIPPLPIRTEINNHLKDLAEKEWSVQITKENLLRTLYDKIHHGGQVC